MPDQNNPICEILPTLSKNIDAFSIYREAGLSIILDAITREVEKFTPDVSSDSGRSEIASIAYKVARSKTFLDDLGKQLVAEDKAKIKKVDQDRKHMRDYLDDLKATVRAPLTEYETAEKERVDFLAGCLQFIVDYANDCKDTWNDRHLQYLEDSLFEIQSVNINDNWMEFKNEAQLAKEKAIETISFTCESRRIQDAKDVELERLRAEAAKREEAEAAEKAKTDQEAREKAAAEAAAKAEREKIEREIAEKEAVIAAEKAVAEQKAIAEAAEKQAADDAVKLAEERRKNHAAHRAKVEREAVESLLDAFPYLGDIGDLVAQQIIKGISEGHVQHVILNY